VENPVEKHLKSG